MVVTQVEGTNTWNSDLTTILHKIKFINSNILELNDLNDSKSKNAIEILISNF